jgi:hypothetical protein
MMNYFYSNWLIWGDALVCGNNNSTTSLTFIFRWMRIFWITNRCSLDTFLCLRLQGSIRCVIWLSCRIINPAIILNAPLHCSQVSNVDVKNPLKSLRLSYRLVFLCPCSYPSGNAHLALFRFAGVIIMRYRLLGTVHSADGRPADGRPADGRPASTHNGKFIGNEFAHYIHVIHSTGRQSCCCLFQINRLDNYRLTEGWKQGYVLSKCVLP